MKIKFYKVACGDAAVIAYDGTDGKQHFVFIDSGYERTYRDILAAEIDTIAESNLHIDLWVISHIHDDHIGGALSYINAIQKGEVVDIVSQWWFNPPYTPSVGFKRSKTQVSDPISFAQGEKLSAYLVQVEKLPKKDIIAQPSFTSINGLNIIILSPTTEKLRLLKEKYKDKKLRNLDYHALTENSEPISSPRNDYFLQIGDFNINSSVGDDSIENGSSISFITDYNSKKVLWLADAIPSVIVTSLKQLGYSPTNPLMVDLVKVAHHGSKGNNSSELYSLIRCTKYVFSADGENKHQLPTKECMARILRNPHRPKDSFYEFLFTYDTPKLRNIFLIDGGEVYKDYNFKMLFSEEQKWLEANL